MNARLVAFGSGVVFALGLALSGMLDTSAVVGFLDLAHWDPRLMFVMGGAIGVMLPVHRLLLARHSAGPLASVYHLPTLPLRDPKLYLGAVLFGVGWALVGYCPGPAIVSLGAAAAGVGVKASVTFSLAMVVGMILHRLVARALARPAEDGIDA